jgi:site-specific DNA recombinase
MKKLSVAIYVRVSTQEQAKEGYSVGEQTDRLRKFAEAHDWIIVKIYTDAGHSGANTDRPALQQMIEDLKAGKIDKVLVYKLDRLSRSQKDTLELIEDVFLPNNTDFESMTEKLDTSTPQGRLFLGILAAFAQLEREMISERMSMGMYARIKEGKWRGGAQVPYGYDYEPALEKLVVNEYESMIVKELFDLFTEGKTLYSIEKEMIAKGHTFHEGRFDRRTSRYILRNKTYCGYMRYKDEWIEGLHDAIIDEETYEKAQAILDENKRKFHEAGYKTGTKSITTNFGGLIYCGRCGAKYSKYQTGCKEYGFHQNYTCHSRHKKIRSMIKDPNCKNKSYRVHEFDEIIFNEIRKFAIDPEYIKQVKKESEKNDDVQQIHAIEKQIKSINSQISRFMDLYGLGKYDMHELDEKTTPLNEQRTKLKRELERLQESSKRITEPEVLKLVESFDEVIEKGDLQDRRFIIEQLIDRIIIDGDVITIKWNFI